MIGCKKLEVNPREKKRRLKVEFSRKLYAGDPYENVKIETAPA